MTECYRYAVDTYEQMTDAEKAKISLDLLYNAICYFHGDALEIVQKLLHMDQATLSKFGASLTATRQQVKKMHKAALAAMPAVRERNRPMLYIPCLRSGAMRDGWHCTCWVRLHGPNRWTSRRWPRNMDTRYAMCFASTAG